jgi:hypothetical protein
MLKEPLLSCNQYAVVMADGATGHVLTTEGNICLNGEGEVYVVFEKLETARKFIEQKQDENDTWEFVIYNSNNECVEHREARKWKR